MERKGGLKKYDIVVGLLNPKDDKSGRQSILLELIDKTTGVVLGDDEKLNKTWTLYDIGTIVVDPKDRSDEQKEIIRRLRKLSLKK
jgi:hypothetical protein